MSDYKPFDTLATELIDMIFEQLVNEETFSTSELCDPSRLGALFVNHGMRGATLRAIARKAAIRFPVAAPQGPKHLIGLRELNEAAFRINLVQWSFKLDQTLSLFAPYEQPRNVVFCFIIHDSETPPNLLDALTAFFKVVLRRRAYMGTSMVKRNTSIPTFPAMRLVSWRVIDHAQSTVRIQSTAQAQSSLQTQSNAQTQLYAQTQANAQTQSSALTVSSAHTQSTAHISTYTPPSLQDYAWQFQLQPRLSVAIEYKALGRKSLLAGLLMGHTVRYPSFLGRVEDQQQVARRVESAMKQAITELADEAEALEAKAIEPKPKRHKEDEDEVDEPSRKSRKLSSKN